MTYKTKSEISSVVVCAGFVLALPFLALAALFVVPAIFLSEKIHKCTYEYNSTWDSQAEEFYKLCTTCGDRIVCEDKYD
jgi:hypothetical protein